MDRFRWTRGLASVGLILWLAASAMAETIYRQQGPDGGVIYSDRPDAGAEPLELGPVNTAPAMEPTGPEEAADRGPEQSGAMSYRSLAILTPAGTVANGLAEQWVEVELEPDLQPGHHLEVQVDGEQVATGKEPRLAIGPLARGRRHLAVQVVAGAEVLASAETEVFVYWPGKRRSARSRSGSPPLVPRPGR